MTFDTNYYVIYQNSQNPKELLYEGFIYHYQAMSCMDRKGFWYVCMVLVETNEVFGR